MIAVFDFDSLKIRFVHPTLDSLELNQRIQHVLRSMILDGVLRTSTKLPATRSLAKALGISRDTVENAYTQLQRDGFIVRRTGSGSYVTPTLGAQLKGANRKSRDGRAQNVRGREVGEGLSKRGHAIFETGGVRDEQAVKAFVTGLPETRSFPIEIWERLQRKVVKEHRASVLLHGDSQGEIQLRSAIATYLNLERGAKCIPEQILVLSSTRQGLFLAAHMLVDSDDRILVEDPGYYGARKAFLTAGARIQPIEVDQHGINTSSLKKNSAEGRCVYVTPSHQYPTGVTMSLERRLALIDWAGLNDKWIIEDDYDSEFHYEGQPTACIQGLDKGNRTIYVGTLSKTLYPGLRMGYMVLPQELVKPFAYARSMIDGHTPTVQQLTLARFMDEGYYTSHIRAMRKLYAQRRDAMLGALEQYLEHVVEPVAPAGGLQIPCFLKKGWTEQATIASAARAGIKLMGMQQFYYEKAGKEGWLLGYSSLSVQEIVAAIKVLATVFKKTS